MDKTIDKDSYYVYYSSNTPYWMLYISIMFNLCKYSTWWQNIKNNEKIAYKYFITVHMISVEYWDRVALSMTARQCALLESDGVTYIKSGHLIDIEIDFIDVSVLFCIDMYLYESKLREW